MVRSAYTASKVSHVSDTLHHKGMQNNWFVSKDNLEKYQSLSTATQKKKIRQRSTKRSTINTWDISATFMVLSLWWAELKRKVLKTGTWTLSDRTVKYVSENWKAVLCCWTSCHTHSRKSRKTGDWLCEETHSRNPTFLSLGNTLSLGPLYSRNTPLNWGSDECNQRTCWHLCGKYPEVVIMHWCESLKSLLMIRGYCAYVFTLCYICTCSIRAEIEIITIKDIRNLYFFIEICVKERVYLYHFNYT